MAPEYGEMQALSLSPTVATLERRPTVANEERPLPTMDDLDDLVAELDSIDATLADLS